MARDDPTETGGLFIGRRPGSAPLKYRTVPERSGSRRQRADGVLANVLLAVQILLCLSAWGAQPFLALWVGSQLSYRLGSLFAGIVIAFLTLLITVCVTLAVTTRLDGLWRILRRAAGHDQKEGALGRIWLWTAIVVGGAFAFWFVVINGPGSTMVPGQ